VCEAYIFLPETPSVRAAWFTCVELYHTMILLFEPFTTRFDHRFNLKNWGFFPSASRDNDGLYLPCLCFSFAFLFKGVIQHKVMIKQRNEIIISEGSFNNYFSLQSGGGLTFIPLSCNCL